MAQETQGCFRSYQAVTGGSSRHQQAPGDTRIWMPEQNCHSHLKRHGPQRGATTSAYTTPAMADDVVPWSRREWQQWHQGTKRRMAHDAALLASLQRAHKKRMQSLLIGALDRLERT